MIVSIEESEICVNDLFVYLNRGCYVKVDGIYKQTHNVMDQRYSRWFSKDSNDKQYAREIRDDEENNTDKQHECYVDVVNPDDNRRYKADIKNLTGIMLSVTIMWQNGFMQCPKAPYEYYWIPSLEENILFHIDYNRDNKPDVYVDNSHTNWIVYHVLYAHEIQQILRKYGLKRLADNFDVRIRE